MTGFLAIAPALICCTLALGAVVSIGFLLADMLAVFGRLAEQDNRVTDYRHAAAPNAEIISLDTRRAGGRPVTMQQLRAAA